MGRGYQLNHYIGPYNHTFLSTEIRNFSKINARNGYNGRSVGIFCKIRMIEYLSAFLNHPDLLKYLAIPVIAALIGWTTNWVAIKLTFYPVKFIGIPPYLGWQGIIPRKGERISQIVLENTLERISSIQEIFEELEPEEIASQIARVTEIRAEELIDGIMNEQNPVLWENLPNVVRKRIYDRTRREIPKIVPNLLEDLQANIEDLVDPKETLMEMIQQDIDILNRFFIACGKRELDFVVNSGLWFGGAFGIIQMFTWYSLGAAWVLPAFGLLVGIATNWLALNIIFRPLQPMTLRIWPLNRPIVIQGLFLQRQHQVSEVFCKMVTDEILTVGILMREVFYGRGEERANAIVKKHLRPLLDDSLLKPLSQLAIGPEGYVNLKRAIQTKTMALAVEALENPAFSDARNEPLTRMLRVRMQAMSPAEFQNLLRPAFKEDEWILITLGGVLGFAAGTFQLAYMFAGA